MPLCYDGRLTAEVMIDEIGRRPGGGSHESGTYGRGAGTRRVDSAVPVGFNREGYALAAGMALGLITLGQGRNLAALQDLNLPDRLRCSASLVIRCCRFSPQTAWGRWVWLCWCHWGVPEEIEVWGF